MAIMHMGLTAILAAILGPKNIFRVFELLLKNIVVLTKT